VPIVAFEAKLLLRLSYISPLSKNVDSTP